MANHGMFKPTGTRFFGDQCEWCCKNKLLLFLILQMEPEVVPTIYDCSNSSSNAARISKVIVPTLI